MENFERESPRKIHLSLFPANPSEFHLSEYHLSEYQLKATIVK